MKRNQPTHIKTYGVDALHSDGWKYEGSFMTLEDAKNRAEWCADRGWTAHVWYNGDCVYHFEVDGRSGPGFSEAASRQSKEGEN